MRGKCLYVATVTEHIKAFHIPYLKWLKDQGWEVHVATNGDEPIPYCDKKHNISIQRSPFKPGNIKAYFQLNAILKKEKYDLIHGHTPMGGALARLCSKKHRKTGTKIIYTAHGFHFYKGAPLINWLLYYPMEKWLSRYTDALITMNSEDYELAQRKMRAKKIYCISGIGVDIDRFSISSAGTEAKRAELGIPSNATVALSIGELIRRKNHETVIRAINKMKDANLFYVVCGRGVLMEKLTALCIELNVEDRVMLLGYRTDTAELLHMSDLFLFPSFQEGLPVALMEAMSAGLPCIVSGIRGNVDLIKHEIGGLLCSATDVDEYCSAITRLAEDENLRRDMGSSNKNTIKKFDLSVVMEQMIRVYGEVLL